MNSRTLYPVYILWLRQVKRYFRSRSRIIGSLGQPILFLVVLGFGFGPVFAKAGGGDYINFLAPGIIAMGVLFSAVFSGIEIMWDRQFGFLKETLVAPVSRMSIMAGRTLGGATTSFIQGLLVFIVSLIAGFRPDLAMIPLGLVFMFAIAVIFTAIGTAIGSVMEDMQGFGLVVNLLIMPLFFLSGSLFPLDTAPAALQYIAIINPLTYGVDAIRAVLVGLGHFSVYLDTVVLAGFAAVFLVLGAWAFAKIKI